MSKQNKVTRHVWMEIIFKLIIFITITSRKHRKGGSETEGKGSENLFHPDIYHGPSN